MSDTATVGAHTVRELGIDLVIRDVRRETTDAVSITFDATPASDPSLRFRAGQFLTLRIPSDRTGSVARCYSLASAPTDDEHLRVAVKRTESGYGSNWLCDNASPGMTMRVLPPAGTFTVDDPDADLVLFAAGSGITPMLSILKTVLRESRSRIHLYYANRDESSIIFGDEINALAAEHADRITVEHWLEEGSGLPTAASIKRFAESADHGAHAMICGPAPFMRLVSETLSAVGRQRIRTEEFVSIEGDPFTLKVARAGDDDQGSVMVTLDGTETVVPWPGGTPLLDALLAAGIDAPYSCREGDCGSCMCLLRRGEVTRGVTDALDEEDVSDGFILACQATQPRGEVVVDFDA